MNNRSGVNFSVCLAIQANMSTIALCSCLSNPMYNLRTRDRWNQEIVKLWFGGWNFASLRVQCVSERKQQQLESIWKKKFYSFLVHRGLANSRASINKLGAWPVPHKIESRFRSRLFGLGVDHQFMFAS